MRFEVTALTPLLLRDLVRQSIACPNLSVRVRVRTTHHVALVLKDLHPTPRFA